MDKLPLNWSENVRYAYRTLRYPETVEEIATLVRDHDRVKGTGTQHTFSRITDTSGCLLSLQHFDKVVRLDRERHTVTVQAGIRYGELCRYLHSEGFALRNLASLPHISVGGACATATHGSGLHNGNLATSVRAIQFVDGMGQIVTLSEEHPDFVGAVVGLGALGIVTELTLEIVEAFEIGVQIFHDLPLAALKEHGFEEIMGSGYSVSLFTDWQPDRESFNQVWLKRHISRGDVFRLKSDFFGATPATSAQHPIGALSEERGEQCIPQCIYDPDDPNRSYPPGPAYERLPHFQMDFTPSAGEELQAEYILPCNSAVEALHLIKGLREQIAPLLQICEVRTVAADSLWMSTCYARDSVALHFTWHYRKERRDEDEAAVRKLLPEIEATLAPFGVRPHWGKMFDLWYPGHPSMHALYPKLPDFQTLCAKYDPEGKFRNDFLDRYIRTG